MTLDCPQNTQLGTILSGSSQFEKNFPVANGNLLVPAVGLQRPCYHQSSSLRCCLPTGVARPAKMLYHEQEEKGPQWHPAGLWKPSPLDPRSISDASVSFYLTMEVQGRTALNKLEGQKMGPHVPKGGSRPLPSCSGQGRSHLSRNPSESNNR